MDDLDRVVKEFFESPDANGSFGKVIDNASLNEAERRSLVEELMVHSVLGTTCHLCGDEFTDDDFLLARHLGPIADGGRVARAHDVCWQRCLIQFPDLKAIAEQKKSFREMTEAEQGTWRSALSAIPRDSLYAKLFGGE